MKRLTAFTIVLASACILLPAVVSAGDFCHRRQVIIQREQVANPVVKRRVVEERVVEKVVHPDYYYSTRDYYRDQLLVDAIVGKLLQLQRQGLLAPGGQPGRRMPIVGGANAGIDPQLVALTQRVCIKCHQQGNAGNGLVLTDLATVSEGQRWKAYGLVNGGIMPKGGQPVSDDEAKLFFDWAQGTGK